MVKPLKKLVLRWMSWGTFHSLKTKRGSEIRLTHKTTVNHGEFQLPNLNWWVDPGFQGPINYSSIPSYFQGQKKSFVSGEGWHNFGGHFYHLQTLELAGGQPCPNHDPTCSTEVFQKKHMVKTPAEFWKDQVKTANTTFFWGHLTPYKGHLTIPKRSQRIAK